jgi:transposase
MANHRKFSAEFRAEAVELVVSSGRPIAQIAPEIGVVEGTLGDWVRMWKQEHPDARAKGQAGSIGASTRHCKPRTPG